MKQKLTIIRGLPGSGKSTLAKSINAEHVETDMYFYDRQGNYKFNPDELTAAHQWCEQTVQQLLREGHDVVVSNTFVQYWEMKPYIELARKLNVDLEVITCEENYMNTHGVDKETIEKMRKKWQPCDWLVQQRHLHS